MSNNTIREAYGITGDADFDATFSVTSIESILFYIYAATAYVIEQMFDQFRRMWMRELTLILYQLFAGIIAAR